MTLTPKQIWQRAYQRLLHLEAEIPASEQEVDALLDTLPLRLPQESYLEWLKRGQRMAKVIPFNKMNFSALTVFERFAADTRDTENALPEIPLVSMDGDFRLTIETLPKNHLKLTVMALGEASMDYANCLIGIAASDSKDQIISLIHLNEEGDGVDETLENTAAVRQALLRPFIAKIEQHDA